MRFLITSFNYHKLNLSPATSLWKWQSRPLNNIMDCFAPLAITILAIMLVCFSYSAFAATSIPFTINLSEAVNLTGTPRIAIVVGGVTRYASYTSGSGTNTLVFTYTMVSGDVDLDGVAVSSPIDLNGGTIKDIAGNNASLTFTPPNTSGVIVNAAIPSGYSVAYGADTLTNVNKANLSFIITSPKVNRTYNYSITSSGGGSPLTGSGTLTISPFTIGSLDVSGLPDGLLTLSLTLTDSLGGIGLAATDTIPKVLLNSNLIGHWTFDSGDISGTTAYDRSGNNQNGTINNGPTQTSLKIGGALHFDGVDDSVRVSPHISASAYSYSAWFKPESVAGWSTIVGDSGAIGMQIDPDGFPWFYPGASGPDALVANTLHHIVGVTNGTYTKIYIDGALLQTATIVT
jgi:hypothetical protein